MKRVVIVDDCKLTLAMARDILAEAGYDVVTTETGMIANRFIFGKPRPHLILVDVEMPMVSGDRFVRLLKSESCLEGIPVILMSQKEEAEMKLLCGSSGADGYLVKPLRRPMLLQLLARYQ